MGSMFEEMVGKQVSVEYVSSDSGSENIQYRVAGELRGTCKLDDGVTFLMVDGEESRTLIQLRKIVHIWQSKD